METICSSETSVDFQWTYFALLILQPWRWRQYPPPKRQLTFNGPNLLCLFFDPEDGGNMLLRNVSWLSMDIFCSAYSSTLKMEAICSFERSVDFQWTYFARLILRPWRWRQYAPPKLQLTFHGLHGVVSQKTALFITKSFIVFYPGCWKHINPSKSGDIFFPPSQYLLVHLIASIWESKVGEMSDICLSGCMYNVLLMSI
jgi:hypothetical protein